MWGTTCDADDDRPISGVEVTVYAWRHGSGYDAIHTALSDADGEFYVPVALFRDVITYELHFRRDGYRPRRIEESHGYPLLVQLRQPGPLGWVRMQSARSITGQVRLPDGSAARGGHLLCMEDFAEHEGWDSDAAFLPQELPVPINADGSFRAWVRGKRVSFWTCVPGYVSALTTPVSLPRDPGTVLTVDIRNERGGIGRVVDEAGTPVPRAVVRHQPGSQQLASTIIADKARGRPRLAESIRYTLYGLADNSWQFPVTTDEDGRFPVTAAPGARLEVEHPDFHQADCSVSPDGDAEIQLRRGSVLTLSESLLPGQAAFIDHGPTVYFFDDGDRYRTKVENWYPPGVTHEGACTIGCEHRVLVVPGREPRVGEPLRIRVVEADTGGGVADARVCVDGAYTSFTDAQGWTQSRFDSSFGTKLHVSVQDRQHRTASYRLPRKELAEPLIVKLEPAADIRGRVLHHDRSPWVGAIVTVFQPRDAGTHIDDTITDDRGCFRIPTVARSRPVKLTLRIPPPCLAEYTVTVEPPTSGQSFVVPDWTVPDFGRVQGVVIDDTSGAPASGELLWLSRGETQDFEYVSPRSGGVLAFSFTWHATTDQDGRFEFSGLLLEEYEILVLDEGYLGNGPISAVTVTPTAIGEPSSPVVIRR